MASAYVSPPASPTARALLHEASLQLNKERLATQLQVFVRELERRRHNVATIQKYLPDKPGAADVHLQLTVRQQNLARALADCRKAREHVCLTA